MNDVVTMNALTYFDTHGHLNMADYDVDREAAIERARAAGVGMITVGVDLASSRLAVELAKKHPDVWAIVGLHPTDSKEEFDVEAFRSLARHPRVVAIGECGLDYFHAKPEEFARQRIIFQYHIDVANEVGKPLMLHIRNGKIVGGGTPNSVTVPAGNAYADALAMLRDRARVRFNSHFFAGTADDMKAIFDAGGTVSFTGVLTFAKSYDMLIRTAPLDRIMTETDCPFVAPVPYRGKRNEPSYVVEVVKAIARIRGEDEKIVAARLRANVKDFFGI